MRSNRTNLSSALMVGTAVALVFAAPNFALAQADNDATANDTPANDATELPAIVIEADAIDGAGDPTPPAYAGGQVATGSRTGVLGNKDNMETPFNTVSFTDELIKNQQAETIADVMNNDASVVNSTGYGTPADRFTVRGFDLVADDVSVDGLVGTAPRQISSMEMYERVEIVKGASAFLNGMAPGSGSLGGSINLVPKRATDEPITDITLDYTNDQRVGTHLDVGRRFGENNEWGIRTNLLYRAGEGSIDDEESVAKLGSLALDYRGERARINFDAAYNEHNEDDTRPSITLDPGLSSIPNPPSSSKNFANDWSYADLEDYSVQLRGEYDVTDDTMVYAAIGKRTSVEMSAAATPTLTDPNGNLDYGGMVTDAHYESTSSTAGVRHSFDTGAVSHEVNLGASGIWQRSGQAYDFYNNVSGNLFGAPGVGHGSLLMSGGTVGDPGLRSKDQLFSYFVSDTVGLFEDRLQITAGVRHQEVSSKTYNYDSNNEEANYRDDANSPMFGIVGKLTNEWSAYANYIEGLSVGGTAPATTANPGERLAPYTTEQFEFGLKADYGTFGGGIAFFQIEQPFGTTNASNVYVEGGEQRNRGIELSAFGEPVDGVRVLGGITFMDAELVDTEGGTNDGNTAKGVPDYQAVASVEYDLPFLRGATVSGRVLHTSEQYATNDNNLKLDSWTRLDVGARYESTIQGYPVTWRANIENLTDEDYWQSASSASSLNYITMGSPMTAKLALTAHF
ncbi:TonB-dependent receptor [Thalassospira sp. MA62]|nr:TonB-dependent receptor [Thalassospira sp. MA62]